MSADPIMLSVNGDDSGHLNMDTSTAGALAGADYDGYALRERGRHAKPDGMF